MLLDDFIAHQRASSVDLANGSSARFLVALAGELDPPPSAGEALQWLSEHQRILLEALPTFSSDARVVAATAAELAERSAEIVTAAFERQLGVWRHDLRSPLTAIYGALNMLEIGIDGMPPERLHHFVDMAIQSAEHMNEAIVRATVTPPGIGTGPRVLVYSAIQAIVDVVELWLSREDYQVQAAATSAELLAAAREQAPRLLLLDAKQAVDVLPVLEADEALRQLPVVILGSPDDPLSIPVHAQLPLPFKRAALLDAVKLAAGGENRD